MRRPVPFPMFVAALVWVASQPGWTVFAAELPRRLVEQYALTSANDFPQRDPQNWELLGSNDGGQTWTNLDVRRGELFTERHQRRIFPVAHPARFNAYRLQIERVRDPVVGGCVQLADIEPLAATSPELDPMPIFADVVTAQGDNAPWETPWQAFDGRPETKWLDRATNNPGTRASWIQWQYTSATDVVITNTAQLRQMRRRAAAAFPVDLETVVIGRLPDRAQTCLMDRQGHVDLPDSEISTNLVPGQRVRLQGTSAWTDSEAAVKQCRIEIVNPGPAAIAAPLLPEQALPAGQDWLWAEVIGRIQFNTRVRDQLQFELQDETRSLLVHVLHPGVEEVLPTTGTRVKVRGICGAVLNSRGEPVAGVMWTDNCGSIAAVDPGNGATNRLFVNSPSVRAASPGILLTNIAQIRQLTPEQLVRWPRVQVRGVITELFGAYLQEDAAGIEVWYGSQAPTDIPPFAECIEVTGRGDWALGHGPIIRADRVRSLGPGKLPRAERCSWSQLASGRMADQWCELEAVVRATDGSHLLLSCEGGQLMATIRAADAAQVRNLVDATLLVRGVSVAATDSRGRVQGIQLVVPSLEFVQVEQPPVDPFTLPTRPIGSLLQVRAPAEFSHRVKVEGVLTFRDGRNYFVQDATGGAMAIAQEEVMLDTPSGGWSWTFWQSQRMNTAGAAGPALSPGAHLQVVGFPEMHGYSPVLTEVMVREVVRSGTVQPVKTTVDELAAGGLDSMLVTMEASLLRQEKLGAHQVLELQAGGRVFQALLPGEQTPAGSLASGSQLRVTGVCQLDPAPYSELGRRVASFKLLVGASGDIVVLQRPTWWTLRRALIAAAVLLVVLTLATTWIAVLHRQVEQRTRQLRQEVEEHKRTEARLAAEIDQRKKFEAEVERSHKQLVSSSRFAGMAEVATSVLHNVGNVLNSANVLASVIVEQVKKSKVESVGRLAGLLKQQGDAVGGFLTEDSRGRQLPGYVERLAAHLAEEQAQLLDKIRGLTESLQHIKEIIAMQQDYARISGVQEPVTLMEVVEDALRMHEGALARHQVQVVKEFRETPSVLMDRHKVLQILFNLLENAKHACDADGQTPKKITVRVFSRRPGLVELSVSDNGVGIPPENLKRIFDQEFSTRQGGHGFGLHSSILAAQDMGATLTADSPGPGQGATFTLKIPCGNEPAASVPQHSSHAQKS